ncbi:MAG: 16S rRNA (cytosine(967)-C(5))-methyltransferase RsmB [Gammaproteobacteria bacterium]|nr:16S rRNA (cytosine(967)-C(5))-methyltransferase RsmB [Gammaproteobacteria bacterium]
MSAPNRDASSHNPRLLAANLVNDVLLDGASLTLALGNLRRLAPDGLSTAQNLAYGALRNAGRLGFYLTTLCERPLKPVTLSGHLLVGLYELEAGETPAYAVVNETVAVVAERYPGARGFANAVLRNFQRRRAELEAAAEADPEARWNLPLWWLKRLQEQYPSDWRTIVEAQNAHPPMTLRVNRRRGSVANYLELLAGAGIAARQSGEWALTLQRPVPVGELPGFFDGLVSVQDLGAQLAAPYLGAADGERVLDACAAPGGKTGHLLELHDLDLVALDSDAARLGRVRENLDRLGFATKPSAKPSATLVAGDAGNTAAWWDGRPFDRILLDAPCTASGVVRRHPDGKWLKRPEDVQQLARQQRRLMDALWPLLKPAGTMLYATCSLFREENNEQVAAFLARHGDARSEVVPATRAGQLLPGPEMDGFFYARLLKA